MTATSEGFRLKDEVSGLNFIIPDEWYLLKNGDVLNPMHKYIDLSGDVAQSLGLGGVQDFQLRYLFGRYDEANGERNFYLPDEIRF